MLWPWPLTFWSQNLFSTFKTYYWQKFGKNPAKHSTDIVETSPMDGRTHRQTNGRHKNTTPSPSHNGGEGIKSFQNFSLLITDVMWLVHTLPITSQSRETSQPQVTLSRTLLTFKSTLKTYVSVSCFFSRRLVFFVHWLQCSALYTLNLWLWFMIKSRNYQK